MRQPALGRLRPHRRGLLGRRRSARRRPRRARRAAPGGAGAHRGVRARGERDHGGRRGDPRPRRRQAPPRPRRVQRERRRRARCLLPREHDRRAGDPRPDRQRPDHVGRDQRDPPVERPPRHPHRHEPRAHRARVGRAALADEPLRRAASGGARPARHRGGLADRRDQARARRQRPRRPRRKGRQLRHGLARPDPAGAHVQRAAGAGPARDVLRGTVRGRRHGSDVRFFPPHRAARRVRAGRPRDRRDVGDHGP